MNMKYSKVAVLILAISFARNASFADETSDPNRTEVRKVNSGLPKVERDYFVIFPQIETNVAVEETFTNIIPSKSIKKIILLQDQVSDIENKIRLDPDLFLAEMVKSEVLSTEWGLSAMERTIAEFLVVTEEYNIYNITVLNRFDDPKGSVSGVLLYGKGFSRRFDFRQSPLQFKIQD